MLRLRGERLCFAFFFHTGLGLAQKGHLAWVFGLGFLGNLVLLGPVVALLFFSLFCRFLRAFFVVLAHDNFSPVLKSGCPNVKSNADIFFLPGGWISNKRTEPTPAPTNTPSFVISKTSPAGPFGVAWTARWTLSSIPFQLVSATGQGLKPLTRSWTWDAGALQFNLQNSLWMEGA